MILTYTAGSLVHPQMTSAEVMGLSGQSPRNLGLVCLGEATRLFYLVYNFLSNNQLNLNLMTIVPNIFKIDMTHNSLKSYNTAMDIIRGIITTSWKKKGESVDLDPKITSLTKGDISYFLYHYQVTDRESDWTAFLPDQLKDHGDFKQTKVNLLLFIQTTDEMFVLVGGSAYWMIAPFIDHLYGLMTYDKIIEPDLDQATSTKSRGMTGQRAGLSEQFRTDYLMINYMQFGKVPKELHVKLSDRTSAEHFSFLLSRESEKLQIAAGKGFRVNKDVDFSRLHQLIQELALINSLAPKDFISSYVHIQDNTMLDILNDELFRKIYNNIAYINGNNDPRDRFEFDFCNPNRIEAFYEADKYKLLEKAYEGPKKEVLFKTVRDKDEIYQAVVGRAYELHGNNMNVIRSYLYGVKVQCCRGTRQTVSSGFMYHFNAEFEFRGDAVFLIDGKWYRLKESFVDGLINQTERVLKNTRLSTGIADKPWQAAPGSENLVKESSYNMLYDKVANYIVFDTIIVDGVELCDILHISTKEIHLVHVKHSFTSRVRELTNQILISARLLTQAISGRDRSYFDRLYDALLDKKRSVDGLTKQAFFDLFMTRTPVYVFATASQLTEDLLIEDNIRRYNSNIARFSLVTCSSEMSTSYYELRTHQIRRA